jgi:hypothetical protein
MKNARTYEAPIRRFYGQTITTATTPQVYNLPDGTREIIVNCGSAFLMQLGGTLDFCAKTANSEVTFTSYLSEAKDKLGSTHVTLSSLNTAANGDYWYVGSRQEFGGVYIDVDGTNDTASTMTGYYYGATWTNLSITDGTSDGTDCLKNDGYVYWTIPTSPKWKPMKLTELFPNADSAAKEWFPDYPLYVVRFQVSSAIDSSVTLDEVAVVDCAITYPYGFFRASTEYAYYINPDEVGALAVYDTAGSKTLYATYVMSDPSHS